MINQKIQRPQYLQKVGRCFAIEEIRDNLIKMKNNCPNFDGIRVKSRNILLKIRKEQKF